MLESTKFFKRLIFSFVLIDVLIGVALAITLYQSHNQARERAETLVTGLTQVLEQSISGIVERNDLSLINCAEEVEAELAKGGDAEKINATIQRQLGHHSEIDAIRIADENGRVVYGTNVTRGLNISIADRDQFIQARVNPDSGLLISKPVIARISGKWVINLDRRINHPNGSFAGIIYAQYSLEHFQELFKALNLGPKGVVTFVDPDLEIIVRQPEPKGLGSAVGQKIVSEEFVEARRRDPNTGVYAVRNHLDNIQRVMSYRRVIRYPGYIFVGIGEDDYLSEWRTGAITIIALMVVILGVTGIAALLLYGGWKRLTIATSSLHIAATAFDTQEGMAITDADGVILRVNRAFSEITGYSADEAVGRKANILKSGRHDTAFYAELWETLLSRGIWQGEIWNRRKNGDVYPEWLTITAVRGDDGDATHYVSTMTDITDRKLHQKILEAGEERLRLALEAANQGWFDVDLKSGKVAVSPEYIRIIGYDLDDFETDLPTWLAHVHPEDHDGIAAAFQACVVNGGPGSMEYRRRTKSGEWKWIHSVGKIVEWDEAHRATRMIGIHTDITNRKQYEEQIENERSRLRTLMKTIPDLVWLKDLEGRYLFCNPEFEKFFGNVEVDIIGKTDYDFVDKELADFFRQKDREAMIAGRPTINEERVPYASDGHIATLETIKTPLFDAKGDLVGVLGIGRDITARKQAADGMRIANAELEQFAYVASHDLRQPLRMVTNYLAVIEKRLGSRLEDDLKTYFGFAVNGAKKMDRLITDLLEYSRTGRLGEIEKVSLDDVIKDSLLILTEAIQEVGAQVSVGERMPAISAIRMELVRLFQNLIGNAIKYRSPDRLPRVEIGWRNHENEYLIWVKDNGMGIAKEQQERAFLIFQRLVPKDAYEGTGIGLAICKKIVEHHGGRIWIESDVGKGSTFFMTFPSQTKCVAEESMIEHVAG